MAKNITIRFGIFELSNSDEYSRTLPPTDLLLFFIDFADNVNYNIGCSFCLFLGNDKRREKSEYVAIVTTSPNHDPTAEASLLNRFVHLLVGVTFGIDEFKPDE